MSEIRKSFASRLKALRTKAGLSQSAVAKRLNVATSSVGNWEAEISTPDFERLVQIADLFEVSVDYLLGRESTTLSNGAEVDDVILEVAKKIEHCDEIGRGAIEACIDYHYSRCTSMPGAEKGRKRRDGQISRLFLVEGKDVEYEAMKNKLSELRSKKRASKKSYTEILQSLWDIGYGDEICLAFVLDIFGIGLNKRVPCAQLYNDIDAILSGKYRLIVEP